MSLNIREAEERARKTIAEPPANLPLPTAEALLALAALYREAVEALEALKYDDDGIPYIYPSQEHLDAVLAKAREALR